MNRKLRGGLNSYRYLGQIAGMQKPPTEANVVQYAVLDPFFGNLGSTFPGIRDCDDHYS